MADLYLDLGCSYHLVQASPGLPPRVPGLTPDGFVRWMVLHLQAFPDGVARRLDRIVSDFPLDIVSVLDGKAERLPKQLSRYLLPRVPDGYIRSLLQQAVKRHFGEPALLAFSFPNEKISRSAPLATQSCPSSPTLREDASPSTWAPAFSHPHRRDAGERMRSEGHQVASPGALPYKDEKLTHATHAVHRRHASYPGPQPGPCGGSDAQYDRRGKEHRRRRSPSRARLSRHDGERGSWILSDKKDDGYRVQHPRRSHRDLDDRSDSQDSQRRSSSRSEHTSQGSSDVRRARHPASPLAASSMVRRASNPIRESARSTTATNTSARRAASPKSHEFRAFMPEIHDAGHGRRSSVCEADLTKHAVRYKVDASRCVSYLYLPAGAAADEAPSSAGDNRRSRAHEYGHTMERRRSGGGDEKDYQLYGSPSPTPPLSVAPGVQHSPLPARLHQEGERRTYASPGVLSPAATAEAKHTATPMASSLSSSRRRRPSLRPGSSLAATVTSLDEHSSLLRDDAGSETDETWDDYLRTSAHVAPVA